MSEIRKNQTEKETKPTLYVYRNEQGQYEVSEYPLHKWNYNFLFKAEEGAEWYCVVEDGYTVYFDIFDYDADPEKWTDENLKAHAKIMSCGYDYHAGEYSVTLRKCVIECIGEITYKDEDGEEYTERFYTVDDKEIVREATATPLDGLIDRIEAEIENCDCHYDNSGWYVDYGNLSAYINYFGGVYDLIINVLDDERNAYNFLDEYYDDDDDVVDMLCKFDIQ